MGLGGNRGLLSGDRTQWSHAKGNILRLLKWECVAKWGQDFLSG